MAESAQEDRTGAEHRDPSWMAARVEEIASVLAFLDPATRDDLQAAAAMLREQRKRITSNLEADDEQATWLMELARKVDPHGRHEGLDHSQVIEAAVDEMLALRVAVQRVKSALGMAESEASARAQRFRTRPEGWASGRRALG